MTLLTDKQARDQLCHLIRHCVNEASVIRDRDSAIYEHQPCRGSDCKIGWRWAQVIRNPVTEETRLGYCGAFGEPTVPA